MPDTALSWVAPAGAWLLTYLVHSTILIGLVWLATRWLDRLPRIADKLWKAALIGGVITASVQVGAGIQPLTGSVDLGQERARETVTANVVFERDGAADVAPAEPAGEAAAATASAGDGATASQTNVLAIALACWLGLALAFVGLILSTWIRLRRRLRGRREIVAGPLRQTLSRLANEAGYRRPIRLTASYDIDVPIAIGVFFREICLPERALYRLNTGQRETMLAHELAHLVRRDPEWRIAALGVRTLLFVQPLNRLASRRLEQVSEDLCDDWAVERTASPLALARCLTEVAEWMKAGPRILRSIPAMAGQGSGLGRRVRRLIAKTAGSPEARRALWVMPAIAALLAALVIAAPGARSAYADTDDSDVAVTPAPVPPASSHSLPPPPTEASVRGAVAGLFPRARRPAPGPAPDVPDIPDVPDVPDIAWPDPPAAAIPPWPARPPVPDPPDPPDVDLNGVDLNGVDIDLDDLDIDLDDLDIHFELDPSDQSIDIHIDGDGFDIDIKLPDIDVEIDIPGLGPFGDVLEGELEKALRDLAESGDVRDMARDFRRAQQKLQKAERKLRKRWRKHRRTHSDCALRRDPFAQ